MKTRNVERWKVFVITLLLALLSWQSSSTASTKAVTRKTVLDYYYLLPDSYFEYPHSKDERKVALLYDGSIADVKNDYVLITLDAVGTLEVVVFRYKNRDLIAVRRYYEGCTLWFFTYNEGQWKDVTKQIMPVRLNEKYDYTLPRYGTTIRVRRDLWPSKKRGQKVYDLVWRKGRFRVHD